MIDLAVMPARRCRQVLRLVAVMLCLPLAACTILPQTPMSQVYLLPAQPTPVLTVEALSRHSIRIAQPSTNQFLNSTRISVQPEGAEITSYAGSRWSDPVPLLLRNRLIQAFRDDGGFHSVSSDEDNVQATIELSGHLLSFQGVYHGEQSEVVIRFDARLVQIFERRVIATHSFVIRQPITGKTMDVIVQAFGLASDQLAAQVLTWTQQQMRDRE